MAVDQINLAEAIIVNAPDIRNWPITTAITQLKFDGNTTSVDFTKKEGPNRWPDVTPAGWTGPLEYTLWLFLNINNQWVGSGFIQFWNGRDSSGSAADPDVPSVYDIHWYYAARWAPMFGYGPIKPGTPIGFMVTSGNARDSVGPYGPQERSNIVLVPASNNATFTFPEIPSPIPVPPTPPSGAVTLEDILAAIKAVQADVSVLKTAAATFKAPLYKGKIPAFGGNITLTPSPQV